MSHGHVFQKLGLATLILIPVVPLVASGQDPGPTLVRSEMSDWPQWRGPARDGISRETGLLSSWPDGGPTRLWSAAGIGRGYRSSCTYDDGKLYHMNAHGRLACLQAETGAELWAVDVLERFEGKNIWAHPVVCQGRLYLRVHDDLFCYAIGAR